MVIEQIRTIRLTLDGANRVFDALNHLSVPNRKLLDVARRMKKQKGFYYANRPGSVNQNIHKCISDLFDYRGKAFEQRVGVLAL